MDDGAVILGWILDHDAVPAAVPGSTTPEHGREHAVAADLESLSHRAHRTVPGVYEAAVREVVPRRWWDGLHAAVAACSKSV